MAPCRVLARLRVAMSVLARLRGVGGGRVLTAAWAGAEIRGKYPAWLETHGAGLPPEVGMGDGGGGGDKRVVWCVGRGGEGGVMTCEGMGEDMVGGRR
jgi:hypothetical protein